MITSNPQIKHGTKQTASSIHSISISYKDILRWLNNWHNPWHYLEARSQKMATIMACIARGSSILTNGEAAYS